MRSRIGAFQNRLSLTINNLSVAHENLSAANSRIRDVDVADETAALTRNQILIQAGVSVLAQANQLPAAALSLLQ
jgi:flagellin